MCAGRVAVISGAGRGLGRCHALALAAAGAAVVVNDLGSGRDGNGQASPVAEEVVSEIRALGGRAVASGHDVADWDASRRLVELAVGEFGRLDVVVNNAGILRDRMLVNMSAEEWDAVMHVHLRGTFALSRWAASHWRERSKAGDEVDARIINTTSPSGLFGKPGQANYGAAKAGIATLTMIAAAELARYGVTVNAVAPVAYTRMTSDLVTDPRAVDELAPEHVSPVVTWLAGPSSREVTGRVFEVSGRRLGVAEPWRHGPSVVPDGVMDPVEVGVTIERLLGQAAPPEPMGGNL
ncbi:SDR family oxidoreductase [Streptosporangium amethystogenes subsp. fukuiense]|uniref:SDR family oxidoreductase n=1 Tax=Streptosporangium amethystogenes subsp. fukuiense TaxID=698418 RepID=A0ABW2SZN0_9ACTN